jgi:hypothetical protein
VDRAIDSVVVSSNRCRGPDGCKVDTRLAAKRIPKRAKVLGEWHTHPHLNGSRSLSAEDVNGAHQNIHIRCYAAYYAGPTGRVYRWDPHSTSVPTAMASRENLGSYRLDGRDTDRPYLATTSPDD